MQLFKIIRILNSWAPPVLQESYDNSGLQCGDPGVEVKGVLVCLDFHERIIEEAIKKGCNLVIAHHPLIFGKGILQLTGKTLQEKILMNAVKNDISLFAIHTNLDNVAHGVNAALAMKLGLTNVKVLEPLSGNLRKLVTYVPEKSLEKVRTALFEAGAGHISNYSECSFSMAGKGTFKPGEGTNPFSGKRGERSEDPEMRFETIFPAHLESQILSTLQSSHPYEEVAYEVYALENVHFLTGAGAVGEISPVLEEDFLKTLKKSLGTGFLRHSRLVGKQIKRVAICGGSGSFLLEKAISAGADVFVTGDVKYHSFFDPFGRILLVDAGHFETEQFTPDLIRDFLNKNFTTFAVHLSEGVQNPVFYS